MQKHSVSATLSQLLHILLNGVLDVQQNTLEVLQDIRASIWGVDCLPISTFQSLSNGFKQHLNLAKLQVP